jgi:uncharacterized protein YndB with AHSA1/START domain
VTNNRHGTASREFPSELEIVTTRKFNAPIDLVFDVLTTPEHMRRWWATGGDRMTICDVDLKVGGDFHNVFVTPDGRECSFRGTYLEVDPPSRLVNSWLFEGWPDAWATETHELNEVDGVTTLKMTVAFRDPAGRAYMTRAHEAAAQSDDDNGQNASFDAMEDLLKSLVESGTES